MPPVWPFRVNGWAHTPSCVAEAVNLRPTPACHPQSSSQSPLQTIPNPIPTGMSFPNRPTFSIKRTPFHPPGFEPCDTLPRSAFGYTGYCEPGEAEPVPEGAAVAGQILRAGCNGLPPVEGWWMAKTSDGLSQPRSQRPSDVPKRHTNKAPDPVNGCGDKDGGSCGDNAKAPRARVRSGCAHIRREPETSRAPGQDVSARDVSDPSPVDGETLGFAGQSRLARETHATGKNRRTGRRKEPYKLFIQVASGALSETDTLSPEEDNPTGGLACDF